jgi:hypothetical protein
LKYYYIAFISILLQLPILQSKMPHGSRIPAKKSPFKPRTKKIADDSKTNKTVAKNLGQSSIPGPSKFKKQDNGSTAAESHPTTVNPLSILGAGPQVPTSTTYTADNPMPSSDEAPSTGSDPSRSGSDQEIFPMELDSSKPKSKNISAPPASESAQEPVRASSSYKDSSM